jgi:DNA replication protein DnaC
MSGVFEKELGTGPSATCKVRKENCALRYSTKNCEGNTQKTVDILLMENKAWRSLAVSDISKEDYGRAKEAWHMGQIAFDEKRQTLSEDKKTILHNMMSYMQEHLKWKIEHLHDACLCVGCCPPSEVNMMSYFDRLHHQCGSAKVAFQPQHKKSHVKAAFVKAIKTLQEGARNMGGVTGSKLVLAERLACILNCVIQAGSEGKEREKLQEEIENEEYVDFATSSTISALRKHVHLAPLPSKPGAIPQQANIDAAMAESSLGWNINDEIDDEVQETVDADIRAEEESIRGVNVNPPGFNYECLAPDATLLSFAEANVIGLTDASIQLDRDLFGGSEHQFQENMTASIAEQKQRFRSTANKEFALQQHAERVAALDPTQFRVYQSIQTWSNQCATLPPLRLLVLGTAGTGKTFTLKCAVEAARMAWNSFESVLLTAHTGVAAVNMGGGAATINSIFKMGGNNADVDLDGDKLEELVEELCETKLVIIDEISTVGAAVVPNVVVVVLVDVEVLVVVVGAAVVVVVVVGAAVVVEVLVDVEVVVGAAVVVVVLVVDVLSPGARVVVVEVLVEVLVVVGAAVVVEVLVDVVVVLPA